MPATTRLYDLREERSLGYAPSGVRSGPRGERGDRELGVIYGVKVNGRQSINTHSNVRPGVREGTKYTLQAMREEPVLIREGCPLSGHWIALSN
jgi:hypothetical protein